ncbi:M15 family metallopeptidase [bacterium]|nr:M15 family metallopeptidase [bacterium]
MRFRFLLTLIAFSLNFALSDQPRAADPSTASLRETGGWIVLPDRVQPRLAPSLGAQKASCFLSYKAIIPAKRLEAGPHSSRQDWLTWEHDATRLYLPIAQAVPEVLPQAPGNLPIGHERVDLEHPLPLCYEPRDLRPIDRKWIYVKDREIKMRSEAVRYAHRMFEAAKAEKIHLRVVSGYRPAKTQRWLYLRKVEEDGLGQKIVAKPGHSEHQLGTAMDVSGLDPKTVLKPLFAETKEGVWVRENATRYGFRLTYTPENSGKTHYIPEPWHLRYIGMALEKDR